MLRDPKRLAHNRTQQVLPSGQIGGREAQAGKEVSVKGRKRKDPADRACLHTLP